jgi:DNA-binding response OmpR family regulator
MKEKVLLLLDADGDCYGLVTEAAGRTGRDAVLAKTSRQAFKIIRDEVENVEAVIVDVDPGAHGLAVIEALSSCADKPAIVAVTGLEEVYMRRIAEEHGAAACLGKPLTIPRVIAAVEAVSNGSRTCDRWGCLMPSLPHEKMDDVRRHFRGIEKS